jgi:hypothetical protein
MVMLLSCRPGTPEGAQLTGTTDSLLRLPPAVKSLCLDTAWLRKNNITFTLVRTPSILQWTLRHTAPAPPSPEVHAISYIYKAIADTACNNLDMQLINIELVMGGGTQTIPVTRHIMHEQQALLTPDVTFNDFNFDGFRDFSIYGYTDSAGVQVRKFYLYDEKSDSFTETIIHLPADTIPRENL